MPLPLRRNAGVLAGVAFEEAAAPAAPGRDFERFAALQLDAAPEAPFGRALDPGADMPAAASPWSIRKLSTIAWVRAIRLS